MMVNKKGSRLFLVLVTIFSLILLFSLSCSTKSTTAPVTTSTTTQPPVTQTTTTQPATTSVKPSATPSETPLSGGILRVITPSAIANLGSNKVGLSGADLVQAAPAIETLLRNDAQGQLVPWLATGWKIGDDKASVTFTLRQGVKFHDGADFNADAVKFNMDTFRASAQAELKAVTSIDVIDPYTVKLTLSQWQTSFLSNFAWAPGRMISPTAIKTHDDQWLLTHPVGTGPFQFVSFVTNSKLTYKKFDGYWQKGKPYLDGIEISMLTDYTVALMSFKSGEADISGAVLPAQVDDLKTAGYTVSFSPAAAQGLAGDSANPDSPFAKLQVRQALGHAIDMDALNKMIGFGYVSSNQPALPVLGHIIPK